MLTLNCYPLQVIYTYTYIVAVVTGLGNIPGSLLNDLLISPLNGALPLVQVYLHHITIFTVCDMFTHVERYNISAYHISMLVP